MSDFSEANMTGRGCSGMRAPVSSGQTCFDVMRISDMHVHSAITTIRFSQSHYVCKNARRGKKSTSGRQLCDAKAQGLIDRKRNTHVHRIDADQRSHVVHTLLLNGYH